MVRSNELAQIQDELSRQLSYAKRRNGLIKKALELFIVCDVDCVFISFSPSGRLSYFFGDTRVEEVLSRIVAVPENLRKFRLSTVEFQELTDILNELKERTEQQLLHDPAYLTVEHQITSVRAEIESVKSELSKTYEPSPESITTIEEANASEAIIEATLARVQARMRQLSENQANDPAQPSSSMIRAENSSDETHLVEPENQPGENNGNNHVQTGLDSQLPLMMPPQNLFPAMDGDNPLQRMSFSNLLMSANVPETLSPLRETVSQNSSLPNSRNSFHQNQLSLYQDSLLNTHQIYSNGHAPEGIQSSDKFGSSYGSQNGYIFPNTNMPSPNYQLPSSLASFQAPYQNPFLSQSPNAVPPLQSPYYQMPSQMHLGESSKAAVFNNPQWPNQRNLQPNGNQFGQRGSYQDLITSGSEMNNIYSPDAGSPAAYFRPPNQQMNNQSMENHSMSSSLALNSQGPLSNGTPQGFQGHQTPATQGQLEAVGLPSSSNKRKLPWDQDDIALRLSNNQRMLAAPNSTNSPPRPTTNAVYNTSYEMMGLAVDPHFRMFDEMSKKEGSSSSQQHQNQ